MNYLGHSIVDEVGGGGGSTNVSNALNVDAVAMQTVLSNFQPAVSLHPYRFSNGNNTVYQYDVTGGPMTQTISGFGSPSSYSTQMTALNYKGTYAFEMIGRFYTAENYAGNPPPRNSYNFNILLGNQIILTIPVIIFDPINISDIMYIKLNGIIDVPNDPGASTVIQTTGEYNLRSNLFSNSAITYNRVTIDLSQPSSRNYHMDLRIQLDSGTAPVFNNINFRRMVGTLNCVHSDSYTG